MRRVLYLVFPLLLAVSGCAVRGPATWRLSGQVLTPPGVPSDTLAQRTYIVDRAGARGACPNDEAVAIDARKSRLKITVSRPALEKQPRGWLADWAARAEAGQCVGAGQGEALAESVLESLPLGSATHRTLMRAGDLRAGYTDLGPGNALEVISPILRAGADANQSIGEIEKLSGSDAHIQVELKTTPDLLGRETALYAFESKPGGGARLAVVSAQSFIQGRVEPLAAPKKNYFTFTDGVAYFRLFYMSDMRAMVVGAPAHDKLPKEATACDRPAGLQCITLPPLVGVNVRQVVSVNGKPMFLGSGATVRDVIQTARRKPEEVLPTLAVTKSYAGKPAPVAFDRSKLDILGLTLTGYEEIRW
jgi:hypothetical protein